VTGPLRNESQDPQGSDYVLDEGSCWVRVKNLAVYIVKGDEGVSVSIYPNTDPAGESITETWAEYGEGEEDAVLQQ